MLLAAHVIFMQTMILLLLVYTQPYAYNEAEGHYRSVSGLIATTSPVGYMIAHLNNWAVFILYSRLAHRLHSDLLICMCSISCILATVLISFNIYEFHDFHMFMWFFLLAFFTGLNLYLALKHPMLRRHLVPYFMATTAILLWTLLFPWHNVHTIIEVCWIFTIYYNCYAITYLAEYIHKYSSVTTNASA